MAEVHQNNVFIDSPDPFWDGSPYIAEPTDDPSFVEYANQLKTTEGFYVDFVPESIFWTTIVPENVYSKYTIEAAEAAVTEFNKLKGADLKLSKILNANCLIISSALYFLTLQCSDGSFYEAKIDMLIDKGCKLVMFRPAKYWQREDKNTNEEGGAEPEGSQIIEKKTMPEPTFTVSKILTNSDIAARLALPAMILQHIVIPKGTHFVDLQISDSGEPWKFRLYTLPNGRRANPVFSMGWIDFVRAKCLQVGDKLTIYGCQDGELHIEVTRTSNVTNEEGGAEPEGSQIIEKKTMSEPRFTVSKILTNSDITARLALPTEILQHIVIPEGTHFVDLLVTNSGEPWKFRLYTRPHGKQANPVFTMGWIDFVKAKCLRVGDKLTISGCQDGELHIEVTRTSNVTNEEGGAEPEGSQIIEKKTMSEPRFTVSKILTNSDITARLALPTEILQHIVIPEGTHFVDLLVTNSGEPWKFRLYTRPHGKQANPVFTMGWIDFVEAKCLRVGDKLTIYGCQDGELHIQVTKTSNVTYPGEPVYPDVENLL